MTKIKSVKYDPELPQLQDFMVGHQTAEGQALEQKSGRPPGTHVGMDSDPFKFPDDAAELSQMIADRKDKSSQK